MILPELRVSVRSKGQESLIVIRMLKNYPPSFRDAALSAFYARLRTALWGGPGSQKSRKFRWVLDSGFAPSAAPE